MRIKQAQTWAWAPLCILEVLSFLSFLPLVFEFLSIEVWSFFSFLSSLFVVVIMFQRHCSLLIQLCFNIVPIAIIVLFQHHRFVIVVLPQLHHSLLILHCSNSIIIVPFSFWYDCSCCYCYIVLMPLFLVVSMLLLFVITMLP